VPLARVPAWLGSSAGARTVAAGAARGHVRFAETIPAASPHPKASAEAADRTAPHMPEPGSGSKAYALPPLVPGAPATRSGAWPFPAGGAMRRYRVGCDCYRVGCDCYRLVQLRCVPGNPG
jgi:hypothetical protein